MELALYHPDHGFYSTLQGFGASGDYITSPELHPAFGALLGRQAIDLWQRLGCPAPFRILEVGGGSGALARALVDHLRQEAPQLAGALAYTMDEPSPSLTAVQRRTLGDCPVRWGTPDGDVHLVLANEVVDALPVYRVVIRDGTPRELRVASTAAGTLCWVEDEVAPAEVQAYFAALDLMPPEGAVAEVNAGLAPWVAALAGWLTRGLALVVDYGYPAAELFSRPMGTLLTYFRHTLGSDPLVRLGRQDISSHVDFTTLANAAHAAGLDVLGLVRQAALLHNLGLADFRRALPGLADRRALGQLVDPRGLGRIQAIFLARGLPGYVPAGLSGLRAWPAVAWPPALAPESAPDGFLDQWRDAFGGGSSPSEADDGVD